MAAKPLPTAETLRQIFRYEPETGKVFWLSGSMAGHEAGSISKSHGYIVVNALASQFLAHRLAWVLHYGEWPTHAIDHLNGCPTDNRIHNLRDCDQSTNIKNSRKRVNNRSGVTGVSWDRVNGKWHATIRSAYRTMNLGRFDKLEDAAKARADAEKRLGFTPRHGR